MSTLDGRPVIVGGGLAGLMTALELAPEPVVVLAASPLGDGAASGWAQGGVAAAIGDDDNASLHLSDTLGAGDGLCDPAAAARVVQAGAGVIERLLRLGVAFDRTDTGALALGLEAAHTKRRIVHAADATGAAVMQAVVRAVRATPSIQVIERAVALRLIVGNGSVQGVVARCDGQPVAIRTGRVVLATGGLGGLFLHSTNPAGAIGSGLALAARAGAALADLEFVQFHPTALDVGRDPMPLVSEAVRGEGAVLVDETGARFMRDVPGAELAPRDVVSRAVWAHSAAGHRVFLDARAALGERLATRFPGITAACRAAGIDPAATPIPVRPAAHFHMGGVAVDAAGRSSVGGLWACGEVACSGLHGANRLASNSLLEAAASAAWVARDVAGQSAAMASRRPMPTDAPPLPDAGAVRPIVSAGTGVLRDAEGLRRCIAALTPRAGSAAPEADPALVGLLIATAALRRQESRGAHARTDYPAHDRAWARRQVLHLSDVLADETMREAA
ncbi:MAG TPA: L-aspartate oxidase [Acidisphaera sp.]|nr:L-aspartate oxidase [Acidisphaera sp.]